MPPLIIAHRGDSARRPENTLAAFASALEAGAEIVELDVQLSRDGHVVVLHDTSVERTTDGRGDVRELTLGELRALSAGYPARFGADFAGERIPTLQEALGFLRGRARVLVEIKSESVTQDAEAGIEALTVAEVRRQGMVGDVALIAFERRALQRCRRHAPEIRRGHLFHRASPSEITAGAAEVGSDLVLPHKELLDQALFSAALAAGLRVATWVVDDPEELRALCRFDLYAVGTNRPGELIEATLENE
jgi:glycerophosphoryl diester phosphodiesterase